MLLWEIFGRPGGIALKSGKHFEVQWNYGTGVAGPCYFLVLVLDDDDGDGLGSCLL